MAELAARFGVHPNMIAKWKKALVEGAADIVDKEHKSHKQTESEVDELYRQDWAVEGGTRFFIQKAQSISPKERKQVIDPMEPALSISNQCRLMSVSRSSFYYRPKPVSPENLKLMRLIDELYLKTPCWGSRSLYNQLQRLGYNINRKRIQRLMRLMGLEAIYPKPRTSQPYPGNKV